MTAARLRPPCGGPREEPPAGSIPPAVSALLEDPLARFAYVDGEHDDADDFHVHGDGCHCGLRGR